MGDKIQKKVADTILERSTEITINETVYNAAPPTTATLIEASELIAELPAVKLDDTNVFQETLRIAKDCRKLGEILAILILGAGNTTQVIRIYKSRFHKIFGIYTEKTIDKKAILAKELLESISPSELSQATIKLLQKMEIAHFFGITTSLIEINLLPATREVETTASGPWSPESPRASI